MIAAAGSLTDKDAVLPPGAAALSDCDDLPDVDPPNDAELQPITGFVCIIEYADAQGEISERLIQCRRYDYTDGKSSVGAICGRSGRYKRFRCDRMIEVTDAQSGNSLGDGRFFEQFAVGTVRSSADNWNTTSDHKSLIVAGLNVLCFMARCDGHWHQLEEQTIEDFVCTLWMREEWENDPPLDRIVAHARRLAPDGSIFGTAIRQYAHSETSAAVLSRFVHRLVAADGVICDHEHRWSSEFDALLNQAKRDHRLP